MRTLSIIIATTIPLVACSGGVSEGDKSAIVAAVSCRDISDNAERLACLDAASEVLAKTSIVRENAEGEKTPYIYAEAPVTADKKPELKVSSGAETQATATPEADFGGERLKAREKQRESGGRPSLTAQIVEIVVNPYEKITVTLDNGQVWRQLDGDDRVVRFPSSERVYTAHIKQGLVGNYQMKIVERDRTIRVRRIR